MSVTRLGIAKALKGTKQYSDFVIEDYLVGMARDERLDQLTPSH